MAKKPLKFYQTLNQAPKGPKHGKHRRAGASSHRDSANGTGHSAGGSGWTTISWNTGFITWDSSVREPEPQPIPYAGIRTGELIGTRAWLVINDLDLRSLAHHFIWEPGKAVTGDISKPVSYDPWLISPIMGGVYAHFDIETTEADIRDAVDDSFPFNRIRESSRRWAFLPDDVANDQPMTIEYDTFLGVAIGTVKLWGEVVEHERGFRAEFAKIVSIDKVCGVVNIDALRAKYLRA